MAQAGEEQDGLRCHSSRPSSLLLYLPLATNALSCSDKVEEQFSKQFKYSGKSQGRKCATTTTTTTGSLRWCHSSLPPRLPPACHWQLMSCINPPLPCCFVQHFQSCPPLILLHKIAFIHKKWIKDEDFIQFWASSTISWQSAVFSVSNMPASLLIKISHYFRQRSQDVSCKLWGCDQSSKSSASPSCRSRQGEFSYSYSASENSNGINTTYAISGQ